MLNTGILAKAKELIDEIRYIEINYLPKKIYVPEKLFQPKIDNEVKPGQLYLKKLATTIKNIFYFTPRIILGKHQFYSVFMAYRMWQTLIWQLTSYGQFKNFFEQILIKLSLHRNHGKTSANTATN